MKKLKLNYLLLCVFALVAMAVSTRLIPHPQNFTPLAAIAIFSGALLGKKWYAFVIPVAIRAISDLLLGVPFYSSMWAVYICLALVVLLGMNICANMRFKNVFATALLSAVVFFVVTNFACWLEGWYGYTAQGLMNCYVAAVPFFRMDLLSTMVYSIGFWGICEVAYKKVPALR
ncbi:MAG: hypothetical protein J5873_03250 [Bacteroidales bacterium]|nr:hypothetical protein [Bacteroidales bacterium]